MENLIESLKPPVPFPRSYWVIPGLLLAGEYPGNIDPDVTERKIAAMIDLGIRHVVNLMESDETNHVDAPFSSYEEMLVNLGAIRGLHVSNVRFQVVDFNIPSPDQMKRILDNIDAAIEEGRPVYVHCWGGIGRTGTVIGCFLLRHGLATRKTVIDAISRLRANDPYRRRTSPENERQVKFVKSWANGRADTPSRLNRYAGCMLGGAVGDALGAPVEFMDLSAILRTYGNRGVTDYVEAYGRTGAITDDTQMTLFTAEGLLRARASGDAGGADIPSTVYESYVQWLNTQGLESRSRFNRSCSGFLIQLPQLHSRRAPGSSCISALSGERMGTASRPINNSKGCGGVMRAAPAGLIADGPAEAFELGCDLAAITHGHPSGYLAAGAFAAMVAAIRSGGTLREGIDAGAGLLKTRAGHDECLAALQRAIRLAEAPAAASPRTVESLGGGWVAEEALAISVYCALCATGDFEKGALLAVNHGGDSDSTGAITGNLLGCLLGSTGIADALKERLELADVIVKLAVDLFTGHRDAQWWRNIYGNG